MNLRHPIPKRASIPPEDWRTTQDYPLSRQAMRPTTAPHTGATDGWDEDEEAEARANRIPNSARRYPTRVGRELVPTNPQPRRQKHPFLYIGIGMLVALTVVALILGPGGKWWTDWRNYSTYGDPRTFQIDAMVGQNDGPGHESHFIAFNLHGQIIVIEFPGSDPSKGRDFVITTLYGPDADHVPVTLTFQDVNGDGKPDMLIHFGGQQVAYINENGTFRPAKPGETIHING